jgi:hypothetical protein
VCSSAARQADVVPGDTQQRDNNRHSPCTGSEFTSTPRCTNARTNGHRASARVQARPAGGLLRNCLPTTTAAAAASTPLKSPPCHHCGAQWLLSRMMCSVGAVAGTKREFFATCAHPVHETGGAGDLPTGANVFWRFSLVRNRAQLTRLCGIAGCNPDQVRRCTRVSISTLRSQCCEAHTEYSWATTSLTARHTGDMDGLPRSRRDGGRARRVRFTRFAGHAAELLEPTDVVGASTAQQGSCDSARPRPTVLRVLRRPANFQAEAASARRPARHTERKVPIASPQVQHADTKSAVSFVVNSRQIFKRIS